MRSLLSFFEDIGWIAGSLVVILTLSVTLFITDLIASKKTIQTGIVYSELYSPDNRSTGVGMAFGNKGPSPIVVSSGHSDQWFIIAEVDGHYHKVKCSLDQYIKLKKGTTVKLLFVYGGITGSCYAIKVLANG